VAQVVQRKLPTAPTAMPGLMAATASLARSCIFPVEDMVGVGLRGMLAMRLRILQATMYGTTETPTLSRHRTPQMAQTAAVSPPQLAAVLGGPTSFLLVVAEVAA